MEYLRYVIYYDYLVTSKWTVMDKKAPKGLSGENGVQWRSWRTADGAVIDQIAGVVDQIKANPDSRRLIVSAWNPGEIDKMALAPCHAFFQFYVNDGALSCQLYQRSADVFLGVFYFSNYMIASITRFVNYYLLKTLRFFTKHFVLLNLYHFAQ